jgi:hypothetical protein
MQGATSTTPLPPPKVARRCVTVYVLFSSRHLFLSRAYSCGPDPDFGRLEARPWNCTYGAKQPLYWYQKEGNNQFEDTYHPPHYGILYNFEDGAQNSIFDPASYNKTFPTSSGAMPTPTPIPLPTNSEPQPSSALSDTHLSLPTTSAHRAGHTDPPSSPVGSAHGHMPSDSGKNTSSISPSTSTPVPSHPHHPHHHHHHHHHHGHHHHHHGHHHYGCGGSEHQ